MKEDDRAADRRRSPPAGRRTSAARAIIDQPIAQITCSTVNPKLTLNDQQKLTIVNLEEHEPQPALHEEHRELAVALLRPREPRRRPGEEDEGGGAVVGDPAGEEVGGGGLVEVGRVERGLPEVVAGVIEGHHDHHDPAEEIDRRIPAPSLKRGLDGGWAHGVQAHPAAEGAKENQLAFPSAIAVLPRELLIRSVWAPHPSELLTLLGSRIASAESLGLSQAGEAGEAGGAGRNRGTWNQSLPLGWPELDEALPDGGLPRGVVELAAPRALGGGASIALAAIRAAHARDSRAWCAWIEPESSLYAPGVVQAGVDTARLLVVRPPRPELARVAVKVAGARAFDVIAIDMDPLPGAVVSRARSPRRPRAWPSDVLVRKLALLAAEGGTTILLLTDSAAPRPMPWPVALRLEIARKESSIALRVTKDRRGRGGARQDGVPLATRPSALAGAG